MTTAEADAALADELGKYALDPLGFVWWAYPWGEEGPLKDEIGPDEWQTEFLKDLGELVRARAFDSVTAVMAVRMAVASGHGIGKSTLVAWVVDWIMSTRPYSIGTITANTFPQLNTKTWAQIKVWTARCITAHWFRVTADKMLHVRYPSEWYCTAQTCKEQNSESFAGQHSKKGTSFYIFDEASAVPAKIFEVSEGGLTDGEPMVFAFGNPTRNTGTLYEACFGKDRTRWNHRSIDSRTSRIANLKQIEEWIRTYGEDSDFVRVRVRGLPPAASELQYIDRERVQQAQTNQIQALDDDPLVVGVDVSGGGSAWNVIRFRRGLDARSIPPIRIPGEHGRDRALMIGKLAELLGPDAKHRIAAMFIDSGFGAAIVERLHTLGFADRVHEINFGAPAPDFHFKNQRAYMWAKTKDWLPRGAIDPQDEQLEIDLTGPGYHLDTTNKLVLEAKASMLARGCVTPDDGDALVLTFARPVAAPEPGTPSRDDLFDQYHGNNGNTDI